MSVKSSHILCKKQISADGLIISYSFHHYTFIFSSLGERQVFKLTHHGSIQYTSEILIESQCFSPHIIYNCKGKAESQRNKC
jgi:hypothetical protein